MKRVLSLWLPRLATDRLRPRQPPSPDARRPPALPPAAEPQTRPAELAAEPHVPPAELVATVAGGRHGVVIVAASDAARARGVVPGLGLAEARAVLPELLTAEADPAGERALLDRLADWATRYTPVTGVDGASDVAGIAPGGGGLWLEVGGSAHLFGGEAALVGDLRRRLAGFGLQSRAAIADTLGAAWAVARCGGQDATIIPPGAVMPGAVLPGAALTALPVAGLRLPEATVAALARVGLRRIGDLAPLPRAPLAARFGETLITRLDQALGRMDEALEPRVAPPAFAARLAFAEPIGTPAAIAAAVDHLLRDLCHRLALAHQGGRRLELAAYRVDGDVARTAVATSRPARAPKSLARLFADRLAAIDPGFGIETMVLAATVVEPLVPAQPLLDPAHTADTGDSLAHLVDRLANRLGQEAVYRLQLRERHIPERTCREAPPAVGSVGKNGRHCEPAPRAWQSRGTCDPHAGAPPGPPRRSAPRGDACGGHNPETPAAGIPGAPAVGSPVYDCHREGRSPVAVQEPHRDAGPWIATPASRARNDGPAPGVPTAGGPGAALRPLVLLSRPEPVEAVAPVPDGPPVLFRWRRRTHRIVAAEGPERIAIEWWRMDPDRWAAADAAGGFRDYYRVEDADGGRFWLFRRGLFRPDRPARWYLHGLFP